MKCPNCRETLEKNAKGCECGWRAGKSEAACACGGEIAWRNDAMALCIKCYDQQIYPRLVATQAEIKFHKRLRDIEAWITKHSEHKTKREACHYMLRARGMDVLLQTTRGVR